MNPQQQQVYFPVQQPIEKKLDADYKKLNQIAMGLTGVSLLFIVFLWVKTVNAPATLFEILVGIQGVLLVYSLFYRWLNFGCMTSTVNIFAWLAVLVSGLVGAYVVYLFTATGLDEVNITVFIAYLLLLGKLIILINLLNKY